MSSENYLKMVEVPVDTCDVIVKPKRRKKKDVKQEVIEMVNDDTNASSEIVTRRLAKKPKATYNSIKNKPKNKKVVPVNDETVTVKSSRFDIISVQVVAIFVLVIGIILTNVFIEDSGMNNLLRSIFGTEASTNISTATYSEFEPLSPTKTGEVSLENGVMTVSSGSVYSPCDGIIESVESVDGKYNVTVRHSESFTTVIKGLELCYLKVGDDVYSSIALGFSGEALEVSMFNNNALITDYSLTDDEIVWIV